MPGYRELGAAVVGVSRDKVAAQERFAERNELDYPLLSDRDGEVAKAYGVRSMLGFANRVSFLIDGEGKIARVYDSVSPRGHAAEVLEDLRRLVADGGSE